MIPPTPPPPEDRPSDDKCGAMLDALSRAAATITGELSLPKTLQVITDIARELGRARYAALGVPNDDGTLKAFITSGMDPDAVLKMGTGPRGHGLLGALLESDAPIRLNDMTQDARFEHFDHVPHPPMRGFLGVPIISHGERLGNLYLTEPLGDRNFDADDERLIVLLANHAAVAIANARLSEQLQSIALSRERDRIGMELHDGVIQSVYAVGMKVEILRGQFPMSPEEEAQYRSIIDDLNTIIEDIRLYIRNLRTAREEQATFRQRLDNLARHFRDFARVEVIIDVPLTLRTLNDRQRHSLTQIVREALSNVARHAHATQVKVKVREVEHMLVLTVRDNGVGFNPIRAKDPESFGLRNMHERAARLGGTFVIESDEGAGTLLTVQVPFRP